MLLDGMARRNQQEFGGKGIFYYKNCLWMPLCISFHLLWSFFCKTSETRCSDKEFSSRFCWKNPSLGVNTNQFLYRIVCSLHWEKRAEWRINRFFPFEWALQSCPKCQRYWHSCYKINNNQDSLLLSPANCNLLIKYFIS